MRNSKKEEVTKVSKINTSLLNTIRYWIYLQRGKNDLSKKLKELLVLLIREYILLSNDVSNQKLRWKLVFDYEVRQKLAKEMDISSVSFENYLTRLRHLKIIIDNEINPIYVPDITLDTKTFILKFVFNITHEESK